MPDEVVIPWGEDSLVEQEKFDEEHVKAYLDECIEHHRNSDAPFSEYYIDAYQSVRTSLFGELKEE